MKHRGKVALIGVALVGLMGPAWSMEWTLSGGGDVRWFDWREEIGGQQLLSESGPLFSPVIDVELRRGPLFAGVESAWGGGLARYNGRLQTGPGYQADAWEEIVETEWRAGWRGDRGAVQVGYRQRDWRRFIEGSGTVSSAEERYRWKLVTLGGEAPLGASPHWHIALTVGLPVESRQKVYTGAYDDFALEPGDGIFWRIALPYRPARAAGRFTLEPYYQQQDMDASAATVLRINGVPQQAVINGVPQNLLAFQPASVRRELGLTLRWRLAASEQ